MGYIRKITAFALSLIMFNGIGANANEIMNTTNVGMERAVLEDYLEATKNKDIEEIINLSNDSRVTSKTEYREFLNEIIE